MCTNNKMKKTTRSRDPIYSHIDKRPQKATYCNYQLTQLLKRETKKVSSHQNRSERHWTVWRMGRSFHAKAHAIFGCANVVEYFGIDYIVATRLPNWHKNCSNCDTGQNSTGKCIRVQESAFAHILWPCHCHTIKPKHNSSLFK